MINRALWFLLLALACASANLFEPAQETGAAALMASQIENPGEPQSGESLRTVVNYSPAELVRAVPELKGLKPTESQEPLAPILRQVGESTEALYRNFINTASREQVFEKRLKDTGAVEASAHEEFRYLALLAPVKARWVWMNIGPIPAESALIFSLLRAGSSSPRALFPCRPTFALTTKPDRTFGTWAARPYSTPRPMSSLSPSALELPG